MVWNTKQWKEQFELLTTQRNSNQKSEAMFLLRNMRADVFKHTLFLVQQGHYYAENGQKINFPNSENLITNTRFYTTPKTVHHLPSLKEETIVKVDSAIQVKTYYLCCSLFLLFRQSFISVAGCRFKPSR